MPQCSLCEKQRELVKSHIIPRAFWRLRDDGRTPLTGPIAVINNVDLRLEPSRLGPYDNTILCEECDGFLGRLDQHAAEKLVNGTRHFHARVLGLEILQYPEADAIVLTRFLASVAWRASKSRHKYFKRVDLGRYESEFKDIFYRHRNQIPKLECIIAEYDRAEVPQLDPAYTRMEGVRFLVVYANRFIFYLKIDKQPAPPEFRGLALTSGKPVLSMVRSWRSSKEARIMNKIVVAMPTPRFWKRR